jgi:hypothetical protein
MYVNVRNVQMPSRYDRFRAHSASSLMGTGCCFHSSNAKNKATHLYQVAR